MVDVIFKNELVMAPPCVQCWLEVLSLVYLCQSSIGFQYPFLENNGCEVD